MRGALWGVVLGLALLGAGCLEFDADTYCAEHPEACTLAVTELRPAVGPAAGGTVVTVEGTAFDPELRVEVGGVPAVITGLQADRLIFRTPPHPSSQQDVVLRGRFETLTLPRAFHYEPPPRIASFHPASGSSLGGTSVTIAGELFGLSATVRVGGVTARVERRDTAGTSTSLLVTMPPMAPGTYDLEVRNDYGGVTVLPGGFRYDVPWRERGAGLFGGDVRALWVDPADPSRVLASVARADLYRSRDGGLTWAPLAAPSPLRDVRAFLFVQGRGSLYAATDGGCFESRDRGETWAAFNVGLPLAGGKGPALSSLVESPEGAVYARASSALYQLAPGASFWVEYRSAAFFGGYPGVGGWSSLAATAAGVYLGTGEGVYLRTPGADAFRSIGLEQRRVLSLKAVPGPEGFVYAGTEAGLYRLEPGQAPVQVHAGGEVRGVFLEPSRPGWLYLDTPGGLQLSEDAGVTWRPVAGLPRLALRGMDFGADGRLFVAMAGAGVFQGAAGSPLALHHTGMRAAEVSSLVVDPAAPERLYAGTPGGLFWSTDAGGQWTGTPLAQVPAPVTVVRVGAVGSPVFVGTAEGLRRSRDAGVTWEAVGPPGAIRDVAVVPSTPVAVYATAPDGVWRSMDGGDTWARVMEGLAQRGGAPSWLAVGPGPAFTVFVVLDYELPLSLMFRDELYAQAPGAPSWATQGALPLSDGRGLVAALGGRALLTWNPSILFIRPPGESSWLEYPAPYASSSASLRTLAFIDAPRDNLLFGTVNGVFRTSLTDPLPPAWSRGAWTDVSAGVTWNPVLSIAPDPSDPRRVYVGTQGGGVYQSTVLGL